MFRLIHISDVHLGPLPSVKFHQFFSKRITGYINWKLKRKSSLGNDYLDTIITDIKSKEVDHIALTGDLINLALPDEYKLANKFLKELGAPENIIANCGNHDAYVTGAMQKSINNWAPYLSGDNQQITTTADYPTLRKREDIALISCNSAEATLPFFATGYCSRDQAKRLEKILQETKDMYRVVMIHHPPLEDATPWAKRLIGYERFQEVITKYGAELILHGHTHQATINKIAGPNNEVPVVCVPATGKAPSGRGPAGRYNLFSIEKNKSGWSTTMEEFGFTESSDGVELISSRKL